MGILSNVRAHVILLAVLLIVLPGCQTWRQYRSESKFQEFNAVFVLDRNQPVLSSATLNGVEGRFIVSTASPRTVVDASLGRSRAMPFHAGNGFNARIEPETADLGAAGDALIGADAWGRRRISIDYAKGLLTIWTAPKGSAGDMEAYHFESVPRIPVRVGGSVYLAIVDSALPDTLVLPGEKGRSREQVTLAGIDLGAIDISRSAVTEPRIGTRLLAGLLLTIDYRERWVAVWRDPRSRSVIVPREPNLPADAGVSDFARTIPADHEVASDVAGVDAP